MKNLEDEQEYRLSSFKYMGLLRKPDLSFQQTLSTYWNLSENDYSNVAEKRRLQKMNK